MNAVVVDTDVVSYLFKSHPIAYRYLPDLRGRTPMVSFMTVAELDRWVLEAQWGEARRNRLREYLERFVVLPYDRDLVSAMRTTGCGL
jgi:predicted nucleic acid-binding protein